MHYSNGRQAKVGDMVRGRGYNVKHEIIGRLIAAKPHETACNCTIAFVGVNSAIRFTAYVAPEEGGWLSSSDVQVTASLEYGQLDAFVAIDPNTGDVLLPEGFEAPIPAATWSPLR